MPTVRDDLLLQPVGREVGLYRTGVTAHGSYRRLLRYRIGRVYPAGKEVPALD